LGIYRQRVVFFWAKNETDDVNLKKKPTHVDLVKNADLFFMGQALGLAYLAHNAWPHPFF
jgi:hypothetical protein